MIKQILRVLSVGLVVALVAPAQADVTAVITPGSSTVFPSSMGVLQFSVANTAPDDGFLPTSYAVGITSTAFGGATGSVAFSDVTALNGWGSISLTSNVANSFGPAPSGGMGASYDLFSVKYTITGSGPVGSGYNIGIVTPQSKLTGTDSGGTSGSLVVQGGNGATLVYGIPEPTSLGFLAGAAGLVALRRRRRKLA